MGRVIFRFVNPKMGPKMSGGHFNQWLFSVLFIIKFCVTLRMCSCVLMNSSEMTSDLLCFLRHSCGRIIWMKMRKNFDKEYSNDESYDITKILFFFFSNQSLESE